MRKDVQYTWPGLPKVAFHVVFDVPRSQHQKKGSLTIFLKWHDDNIVVEKISFADIHILDQLTHRGTDQIIYEPARHRQHMIATRSHPVIKK